MCLLRFEREQGYFPVFDVLQLLSLHSLHGHIFYPDPPHRQAISGVRDSGRRRPLSPTGPDGRTLLARALDLVGPDDRSVGNKRLMEKAETRARRSRKTKSQSRKQTFSAVFHISLALVFSPAPDYFPSGSALFAKDRPLPASAYRTYFWGARQAYERRDFVRARRLLQTYKSLGSPSDKLIRQVGCDIKAEVSQFSAALKTTRACMARRKSGAHWMDSGKSSPQEVGILKALQSGDTSALEPYVDCAPVDLTAQANVCQDPTYPAAADLSHLASALKEMPEVLEHPNWREFPAPKGDPLRLRWILYTYSDHWKPCGTEAAPLLSLRRDEDGQIRIAGFCRQLVYPRIP